MGILGADGKFCRFKFGWPHADFRVPREAESFARQEQPHIHFSVRIFIMDQGDGINSGFHAGDLDRTSLGSGHFQFARFCVLAAIREIFWVCTQANQNIAFFGAQACNRKINRGSNYGRNRHRSFSRGRAGAQQH